VFRKIKSDADRHQLQDGLNKLPECQVANTV